VEAAEELDLHGPVGLRLDELDEDVAGLLLRADGGPTWPIRIVDPATASERATPNLTTA